MEYCRICGKPIKVIKYNIPICSHKCFMVDFWNQALDDDALIIDGECYHDCGFVEHPKKNHFYGFAGKLFYIKRNTGEIIKTNNLWYNGIVPEERCIPDNAKFITEEAFNNGSY